MGLAGIIVLGVGGFLFLIFIAGIIALVWELRQRNKKNRGERKLKRRRRE
ncbi:hypothetical protein ES703_56841 [subsurface metagenome]